METPSRAPLAHQHCHTRRTSESRRRSEEGLASPLLSPKQQLRWSAICGKPGSSVLWLRMPRLRSMSSQNSKSRNLDPLFVNGRIKDVVLGEPCRDLVRLSLQDNQIGVFTEAYPYHTPSTLFNASFELLHSFTLSIAWQRLKVVSRVRKKFHCYTIPLLLSICINA